MGINAGVVDRMDGLRNSNDLVRLAEKYGVDKWGSHWYAQHYHRHFSHLRGKKINVLEIGVGGYADPAAGGESLRMWQEYFPHAIIYGIDVFDKKIHEQGRIKIRQGSQGDEHFLREVFQEAGSLDIIIDDGSHYNAHVIKSFSVLFPLLSHNGIYAIEDLQTSYWPQFGGSSDELNTSHTSVGFFKGLIDSLNYEEFLKPEYNPSYFDKHIVAMHFYHNLVLIEKGANDEGSNLLKNNVAVGGWDQPSPASTAPPVAGGQKARRPRPPTRTVAAGFAHHQAGRLDRAEVLYLKALERDPEHAEALHLLGVIAYQRGNIAKSIELIERAIPRLEDLPEAHLNLGNALRAAGRYAEATESYWRAIALQPDYGMAYSNLAGVLNHQRLFEDGLENSRRAVELIPDFLGAYVNYADALLGLRRFAEAEAPLRQALDLMPHNAVLHAELGRVFTELERFDEAATCYEHAIAATPDDAAMHVALGSVRLSAQDPQGAESSLRHAVSIRPQFAGAWQLLGNSIAHQGRFEEAVACYHRALELDPELPEAHHGLALIGQHASSTTQVERLKSVLGSPDRLASDRIAAGFALGTLLDTNDQYDDAFGYFAEANTLQRQQLAELGLRFDLNALRRDVDKFIVDYTPTFFSAFAGWGTHSSLPVFVVGMPRSGTSLVEQIAASHSQVFGAGELRDFRHIVEMAQRESPTGQLDPKLVQRLSNGYVTRLQNLGRGATRVVDKMPDHILHLGLIATLFPSARIIFCQREPRDNCLSCYFHRFIKGYAYTCDLADCGRRLLEIDRLASHWRHVLPLDMLVIDYEKLVSDIEGESRRLIDFLGLDWEPTCLEFHKTQRPVLSSSFWQVRQPLFTRSVGRWQKYERHLSPLLEVLARDRPGS